MFILCLLTVSTLTSNNCAAVACLNNSCNLSGVLATVIAPFCFNPVDNPVFFSNSLYKFKEYFLSLVIVDETPNWQTKPAACQVVPDVS